MGTVKTILTRLTLMLLFVSFIPFIINVYGIIKNTGITIKILTWFMPILNVCIFFLLSFFLKNPTYLFKGKVDDMGNYISPNPPKKILYFTIIYYFIFRLLLVALFTYLSFQ